MPRKSKTAISPPLTRRPRRIVTVSGRGVRGRFPSRKSPKPPQFESLVEEMMLHVVEVAPIVKAITTQPRVFEYLDGNRMRRYTPDLALDTTVGAFYVEVKDETSLVEGSKNVDRLRAALKHLKECGERLFIVLRSDLIENDLQCRLTQILRTRPIRRRHRSDIDASLWDPEGGTTPPADIHEQWESAKRECDALLRRIMKRDPDGLLPQRAR
ncbi:hypothetical protein PSP31120_02579 [Pandoraea sputorum]|nr:hypothetical protein PSP31120_02579 [Pandoraea sputorum]